MKYVWRGVTHVIILAIMLDVFGRYFLFAEQPTNFHIFLMVILFGQMSEREVK